MGVFVNSFVNPCNVRNDALAASFEPLYFPFVLCGCSPAAEGSKIAPFTCFRVFLFRIKPVLTIFQLTNHFLPLNENTSAVAMKQCVIFETPRFHGNSANAD
jgi:hypothetical protein